MKRVHAYYSGDVQGVGFRFTAIDVARKRGVKGWVKNTYGEGVEVVAEGEEKALKEFLDDLKKEMSYYIRKENISWEPATGEFSDFQARF